MSKIIIVIGAIYLLIRFFRKPRQLGTQNKYTIEDDQDVEYEEIKEE
jgi:hypothetical protein